MKLYDRDRAPNARRVRIFLAEKGVDVPREQVDLGALQHKSEAFSLLNPLQQVPILVLDDGTVITESIAICRYFEEVAPEPPLFGEDTREIVEIEMWNRRLELNLLFPVAHVFRHTHPAMKSLEVPQVPAWAESNKPRVARFLLLLDHQLEGRSFVTGERLSVADITGFVAIDFMNAARLSVPDQCENVRRWHGQMTQRPSARA
jgi:glutathione S-transferase